MLKREIVPPPEHLYPAHPWQIREVRWSERYHARAETCFALANGYLGMRGTADEGRPAVAPGTYVNGFHESWPIVHPEDAFGLARRGQAIVHVPEATTFKLYVDDEPFQVSSARMQRYERVLDLRAGTLVRDLVWSTASGRHVHLRSTRLVSLEHRHVAAIAYEVELDADAPVVISSQVRNVEDAPAVDDRELASLDPRRGHRFDRRVLQRVVEDHGALRCLLGYRTAASGMALGVGVDHVLETNLSCQAAIEVEEDVSRVVFSVDARAGEPLRIVKFIAYQTSPEVPPQELVVRCRRTLDRVVRNGFEDLLTAQQANLDEFWARADVVVEGAPRGARLQQAIRWNLFQLAQASWRADDGGIPAKGLTGNAYGGHYFWDTEAFVLPFLAYTHPRQARNLLRFRHGMLDAARRRARQLGQRGAMFPWRTIDGEEASAAFQAGTAQYHLNADIAYAIRRYVDVRGDEGFLWELGAEMLVETARLWEDLGFYGRDGRFHVHGVTGPDEYTTVVNDNAYTNLLARANLRAAVAALARLEESAPERFAALALDLELGPDERARWTAAADAMFVPYDPVRGVHPQDDTFLEREVWDLEHTPPEQFPLLLHYHPLTIYRHQVLKQADVVMAMFLLGNEFTPEQKRRNFEYYDRLTTGDSSLSAGIQSIVAAEVGDSAAAMAYFRFALLMDLADVAGNGSDGVHIASAAGAWMALVFGFGGVRDFDGQLSLDPNLPPEWAGLTFLIRFQDRQLRVQLTHTHERYELLEGDPLVVTIRGRRHRLDATAPVVEPEPGSAPPDTGAPLEGAVAPAGSGS